VARFGIWKPLAANWASQPRLTTPDIVCIHTIVGTVAGTDAMWRRTGYSGTFSHFGVAGDGTVTQWQDTAFRGGANYNGNHRIISVECADLDSSFAKWNVNDGSAVPAFTAAQCEALAQLIASMCKAHNIPCVLIPDAKPGRRGIGYHRQGVPGYMAAGAEQWSTAQGKVCPGNRRIAQIPGLIARAQQILTGDDDMAFEYVQADMAQKTALVGDVLNFKLLKNKDGVLVSLADVINAIERKVDAVPAQILDTPIDRAVLKQQPTTLRAVLAWSDAHVDELKQTVRDAIVDGGDVDVTTTVEKIVTGVAAKISGFKIQVTG
jgi:hypothetical protein